MTHEPEACTIVPGTYNYVEAFLQPRGGTATYRYRCPKCGREARFGKNLLRGIAVLCDGRRFIMPHRQTLAQAVAAQDRAAESRSLGGPGHGNGHPNR